MLLLRAGVGLWAQRRYLTLLLRAETAARQAVCPACGSYGRLELLRADANGDDEPVRCRQRGHACRIGAQRRARLPHQDACRLA